ncbi:hypothetical protein [Agrobacterium tumefaciens]|uniref:hypothetical protein n=1 Tax=Agrobacterium tumefaciens TaxID=358 RepID=UPI001F45AA5E|nr:hypothetical protein [Agrobacterium tumefaciens]
MKIAVGIIGLFLGILVLLQSCAVTAGSGLLNDQATGSAGAVGMLTGVLLVIGGAFSFGLPLVGAIIFLVSALMAFIASSQGTFGICRYGASLPSCLPSWASSRRARPS